MNEQRRLVVLLGAPGSGKSTVGALLGERGFRWRDWERWLRDRWGEREAFLPMKEAALADLHGELRAFVSAEASAAVIESTGLSDAPFLEELTATHLPFIVRLDVSRAEAARRMNERARGEHLTDEVESSLRVWDLFQGHVAPARAAELVVDTGALSVEQVAATVTAAFRAWADDSLSPS